jgi:predicted DNA-binding protein
MAKKTKASGDIVKVCSFTLDFETINILEKLSNDTNTSKSKIICDLIKKEVNNECAGN